MSNATANSQAQVDYAYGWWLVRNRWLVAAGAVVMFLIAASGARFLAFNPDARVFFSEDNPHLLALEQLENTYNKIHAHTHKTKSKSRRMLPPNMKTFERTRLALRHTYTGGGAAFVCSIHAAFTQHSIDEFILTGVCVCCS